jgi:regulator of protease activity HflC (stomatin/prohibitin superfamily)
MQIEPVKMARIIKWSVAGMAALILLLGSVGTIGAGERGIKTRFNAIVGTVPQGLYFKLPVIESVSKMEVKTQTVNYDKNGSDGDANDTSQLFGASKDLQDVQIGVVVTYHINPDRVEAIFAQYKSVDSYQATVIEPAIREVVKSTSAQYTAEELVTKRAEYSDKVNQLLGERFSSKDAILETFSVTNFEFSAAFTQAIEAKVTAVQNAEAAKNKLEQVKFEAQQTIETARAEAESIKIQANAINSQGGADYVQLKAIEKWDGHLPQQFIPGSSIPFITSVK